MAEFKLMGRFIAMSEVKEVASSEAGKAPLKKRELYMDCSRYDMYTQQLIGQENKVLLEFGGEKVLDKLAALNLQKDDIISVDFSIVGTPYKDKQTGKNRVFTSIRCYDVAILAKAGQPVQQPAPQPQQAQQAAQGPQTQVPEPVSTAEPQPQTQQDDGNHEEPLPF